MAGRTVRNGYGGSHQALRRLWAARIAAGGVMCARGDGPILPGEAWDLGHDDWDRSVYHGPEHQRCNRAAAGRKRQYLARLKRNAVREW